MDAPTGKTMADTQGSPFRSPSARLLSLLAPLSPVPACEGLRAHQAPDIFALWRAWEDEAGRMCDIPFWAVVWPGALVLARHILRNPALVAGRSVLDLGCGGGVAAVAAATCGARAVTANDVDPVALDIAQLNGAANSVSLLLDARDLVSLPGSPAADVVLAADLFYERSRAAPTLQLLREARTRGAVVLIADGGRPFGPTEGVEILAEETVPVNADVEGVAQRTVRLLTVSAE